VGEFEVAMIAAQNKVEHMAAEIEDLRRQVQQLRDWRSHN